MHPSTMQNTQHWEKLATSPTSPHEALRRIWTQTETRGYELHLMGTFIKQAINPSNGQLLFFVLHATYFCTLIMSHFSLIQPPYSRRLCNILGDCAIFHQFFFLHIHSWIKPLSTGHASHLCNASRTHCPHKWTTQHTQCTGRWQLGGRVVNNSFTSVWREIMEWKLTSLLHTAGGHCSTAGPEPTNPNKWWRGGVWRARGTQHYDHWVAKGSSVLATLPTTWKRQEHPGRNVSKVFTLFLVGTARSFIKWRWALSLMQQPTEKPLFTMTITKVPHLQLLHSPPHSPTINPWERV